MEHVNYNFHPTYYDQLSEYEWVSDFLKCQEIKDEIKFIKSKRTEIKLSKSAKASVKKRFKASWEQYEKRRIAYLTKFLSRNGNSRDPFSAFISRSYRNHELQRVCIKLNWEDVEKSIDLIYENQDDRSELLLDSERQKRIADLDKAITQLEAQLREHSPAGYFKIRDGIVIEDFRATFTSNWRTLQNKCKAPVNPHGGSLNGSPDIEHQAYQQLEISRAINPKGLDPNPNY